MQYVANTATSSQQTMRSHEHLQQQISSNKTDHQNHWKTQLNKTPDALRLKVPEGPPEGRQAGGPEGTTCPLVVAYYSYSLTVGILYESLFQPVCVSTAIWLQRT